MYRELDYVELMAPLAGDSLYGEADKPVSLPAGMRGTIVSVFNDAYEVEFPVSEDISAWHEVILLARPEQLRLIEAFDG